MRFLTSGAFIWAYYSNVSCVLAEASEILQKFCRVASFQNSRKHENMIFHKLRVHVKVMKMTCATLSFLRVRGVVMEAPRRQNAFWPQKSFCSILAPPSAQFGQGSENDPKTYFLRQGAKRLVFVTVFGYFWRPKMQKMSFGAKFHDFCILGPKMRKDC